MITFFRTANRLFFVLLLAAAVGGCVSYPHPEPYELGTRHTHYQPAYGSRHGTAYGYSTGLYSAYYPWWSVDYFYLGYHHYRPGYYPGYWHASPWYPFGYGSWYYPGSAWGYWGPYPRFGYAWGGFDPYWHYRYRRQVYRPPAHDPRPGDSGYRPQPVGSHGGQRVGPGYRPGIEDGIRDRETMRRGRGGQQEPAQPPQQRSVTIAPRGEDGRGMVIIGGGDNKVRPSRPQPAPQAGPGLNVNVSAPRGSQADRAPPARPAAVPPPPPARTPASSPPRPASPARFDDRPTRGISPPPSASEGPSSDRGDRSGSGRGWRGQDRD